MNAFISGKGELPQVQPCWQMHGAQRPRHPAGLGHRLAAPALQLFGARGAVLERERVPPSARQRGYPRACVGQQRLSRQLGHTGRVGRIGRVAGHLVDRT